MNKKTVKHYNTSSPVIILCFNMLGFLWIVLSPPPHKSIINVKGQFFARKFELVKRKMASSDEEEGVLSIKPRKVAFIHSEDYVNICDRLPKVRGRVCIDFGPFYVVILLFLELFVFDFESLRVWRQL